MGQFIPEWLKTIECKSHELYEVVSKLTVSHCLGNPPWSPRVSRLRQCGVFVFSQHPASLYLEMEAGEVCLAVHS